MIGRTVFLVSLVVTAAPAVAGLSVCNKTPSEMHIALGRFDGQGWMSEGWWAIAAGNCATVITQPLVSRYYYLYASDGGAGSWGGNHDFCVSPGLSFHIRGRGHCAAAGFERKGFFEVDTGQLFDYVQTLSD